MAPGYKQRLNAAAMFGAAGLLVSLIFASVLFGGEGSVSYIARHVLTASLAAALSGFVCAPLVMRSRVWGAIGAGILVPVLAQFLYSMLMWAVAGRTSWTQEGLWTHIAVLFLTGLMIAGWANILAGVLVSIWLRRRHLAGAI